MIIKGCSSIFQLKQISIFEDLEQRQLESLVPSSCVQVYEQDEIVIHEGDRLLPKLHALITGRLEIKKTAPNAKETVIRSIPPGELFAAPAIFGNGVSPATVTCQLESKILTIEREALLEAISQSPEISLKILEVFNQRLQQLHNTVHGLISERAMVRLIKLIKYYCIHDGTHPVKEGDLLNLKLPYYQIARSIGITYEECVRLFKKLQGVVIYKRGGTIIIQDWAKLEAVNKR